MADAKMCDRCGKLYATQEINQLRIPIWRQTRNTNVIVYDICDECVKEFEEFIQAKKEN